MQANPISTAPPLYKTVFPVGHNDRFSNISAVRQFFFKPAEKQNAVVCADSEHNRNHKNLSKG